MAGNADAEGCDSGLFLSEGQQGGCRVGLREKARGRERGWEAAVSPRGNPRTYLLVESGGILEDAGGLGFFFFFSLSCLYACLYICKMVLCLIVRADKHLLSWRIAFTSVGA